MNNRLSKTELFRFIISEDLKIVAFERIDSAS